VGVLGSPRTKIKAYKRGHDKESVHNKEAGCFVFLQAEEEEISSEWTDVGAHKKKGKAQRGSFSRTPPTSALPRSPPLSATPFRLPHATVSRPQPINVSAKAAAEQRPQSKAQNPGCRKPDGGIRLDVQRHPEKQEGHVRTGGGPYGQGDFSRRFESGSASLEETRNSSPVCALPAFSFAESGGDASDWTKNRPNTTCEGWLCYLGESRLETESA
jgi:hypothetical protein